MGSKEARDVIKKIEEQLEREEAIRIINDARRKNNVSNSIKNANNLSIREYKDKVHNNERNRNKRKIKGPKVFDKIKKFTALGLGALVLFLGVKGFGELKDYKEKTYNEALATVKNDIAEDLENVGPEEILIFDNTSKINESTRKEEYILKIGDEEFVDRTISGNGSTVTEYNQIGDSNITDAIKIVANAKNGSWSDAKKAEELIGKIKSGKLDLNFATNFKLRQLSNEQDKTR